MNEVSSPRDSRQSDAATGQTAQTEWTPPTEADVDLILGSEQNGRDYAEQVYGRLEIVEGAPEDPPAAETDRPAQSSEILPGPPPSDKSAWTIVVDLAANQTTREGVTFGADNKVEQLLDLAASTEGRDITIVVQATDEEKNPIQVENGDLPNVTQYVIRDGKIYETFNGESSGTQQDLADLLDAANKYAPSDLMGLIIQSHGNGVEGIRGDAGEVSLDDLAATIDRALVAGGRGELDFINFDSCLMGNSWVLDKVEEVADRMIASPEVEASCSLDVDGQNISEAITRMIDDDRLTPDEAAAMFLDVAHDGLNGGTECTATPTLALYDLESEDNLNDAINDLGESLSQSLADPQNRAAIEDDIEATDVVNGFRRGADAQHRDLGRFLDELEQSIAGGEINDGTGELRAAVDRARDALDRTVVSYFAGEERYEDMSGMTIYLPESRWLDADTSSQSGPRSPLNFPPDLIEQLSSLESEEELEQAIGDIARRLTNYTNFLGNSLPEEQRDDLTPVIESVRSLQSADATNYEERLESVIQVAEAFQQSEAGRALVEEQNQRARERLAEIHALERPEDYQGWSQFIDALAPVL